MRNIAKCRKCGSIIESFHSTDYVICKCDEISVDGGEAMYCGAKDWANFVRVDDQGNEIVPKIKDAKEPLHTALAADISKEFEVSKGELLMELDRLISRYEQLPQNAMLQPVSHYDLAAALILLSSILRCEE